MQLALDPLPHLVSAGVDELVRDLELRVRGGARRPRPRGTRPRRAARGPRRVARAGSRAARRACRTPTPRRRSRRRARAGRFSRTSLTVTAKLAVLPARSSGSWSSGKVTSTSRSSPARGAGERDVELRRAGPRRRPRSTKSLRGGALERLAVDGALEVDHDRVAGGGGRARRSRGCRTPRAADRARRRSPPRAPRCSALPTSRPL